LAEILAMETPTNQHPRALFRFAARRRRRPRPPSRSTPRPSSAAAPSLDALYDLQDDPSELNNLIGRNPQAEQYRTEVVRMKGLLVEWLTRVKSPNLESVKARPLFAAWARR
jgi:hypothetical protein